MFFNALSSSLNLSSFACLKIEFFSAVVSPFIKSVVMLLNLDRIIFLRMTYMHAKPGFEKAKISVLPSQSLKTNVFKVKG